ncbi:unnamed protein product [Brassica rapa subsp. trilocularis]
MSVRPRKILSGPIPKVRRSDESPPLQRRRSFPFPLKQLLSLSMVLMVTPFPSRFRPPPDPPPTDLPPWSLCKSRPFKARFLIVPPEPPEPPDVPLLLAPLLQTLESSINPVVFLPRCTSPVPVAVASPLRFFASTIGLTGTVFVSFGVCVSTAWCRFQHSSSFQLEPQFIFAETSSLLVKLSKGIVSVSSWNKSYLYESCLVLGVSCLEMSSLPLNEDIALPLNLILPQFEDVASDRSLPLYEDVASDLLSLPLYEDVTLCSPPLVPQYGVGTRTFVLLALVSMVSGTDASKNGGLGWCIHGMDEAHDSQSSARILYVVSTLAAEALMSQVVLPSASSAGFSKLQEIWDSIVFFSALHSGMDLNEIAGCLLTNLATLFSPLSFNFYQCTALHLTVAIAMEDELMGTTSLNVTTKYLQLCCVRELKGTVNLIY